METPLKELTMLFAVVLVASTLVAAAVVRQASWRTHARRGLAAAMVVAGLAHIVGPDPFVQHLPSWVPGRLALVYVTGVLEIALGAALVGSWVRREVAGRALAVYLLAVWPANIYVAIAGVDVDGQPGGPYPWVRLPFQVLFVAWALWSTGEASRRPAAGAAATPIAAGR
jgi:uncharacterized membrane protein